ncbi:MAG TPA: serine/threonine-protein kinase, partial [Kofleriaceae bacterium]
MTRNPTRIGRYDLITALATGGMGRIWLGRASGIGGFERKVVIKTLELPPSPESEAAAAMFLDEARLLGLLHHQHIASVFEVGRDEDGRHYMVIDYLEGHSAHDVFERATQFGASLPLDFTLTVASATANGLHYAHTRKDTDGTPLGIVHRDVTPSNVMIGYDGAVQLIDFGIAMAANRKTKTQTGFVKGKVGYLSPEQVSGREVDPRTDVFALGILLYELSTLHRAFRDSSDLATMQRIKAGRVTRPSLLMPNYPLELEIIVMKALQVDPRERFPDAEAMRRALEALGHRLHLVLGDAAIIEVMSQLFDSRALTDQGPASRASDPAFEWVDSDHDLTVRRDPDELLAVLRAENKLAPPRRQAAATSPDLPSVRPR